MRCRSYTWRAGKLVLIVLVALTGCGRDSDSAAEEARLKSRQAAATPAEATPAAAPTAAAPDEARLKSGPTPEVPRGYSGPLPPLPNVPYAPARPIEVTRAVYAFAARNPEVLSYVPCFCGCEHHGHQGNDDCFVASRDADGRPRWEMHGYV